MHFSCHFFLSPTVIKKPNLLEASSARRSGSPGCDSRVLVVMCQARCLASDALENVVDEAVHDSHGLGRDAGVSTLAWKIPWTEGLVGCSPWGC